jgi:Fur family peroxide stress response transcriptional regulator
MEHGLENEIARLLSEKEIRPTYQRMEIMKYLFEHRVHPTADMIYMELKDTIPTFSKTTVYNTLKLFQERGVLSALATDEDQVRYESNLVPHGHFKCVRCGRLFDIDLPEAFAAQPHLEGHAILECQVLIKGICRDCRNEAL